jgi:hypothetical protein
MTLIERVVLWIERVVLWIERVVLWIEIDFAETRECVCA